MHKYYFRIVKGDSQLEFATDDLNDFDTKVHEWVEKICPKQIVEDHPPETSEDKTIEASTTKAPEFNAPQRMDFIEIRDLIKIKEITQENKEPEPEDFEQILEEAIENPKINLEDNANNNLEEESGLAKSLFEKEPKSQIDILILTAFYMATAEKILHYSIKQLNSRLVPLGKEPITHKIIQDALDLGLIETIPDLTGLGDTTEYSLTQRGEDYCNNEL